MSVNLIILTSKPSAQIIKFADMKNERKSFMNTKKITWFAANSCNAFNDILLNIEKVILTHSIKHDFYREVELGKF